MNQKLLLAAVACLFVLGACGSDDEKKDGCSTAADCAAGQICDDGTCKPDPDASACDPACSGDAPICDEAAGTCRTCTATEGCSGATPHCDVGASGGLGACVACLGTDDCEAPSVCDTATNTCVGCTATEGCAAPNPVCDGGTCVACTATEGCVDPTPICDTEANNGLGACLTCTATEGCGDGAVCDTTVPGGACVECVDDGDCEEGLFCDDGSRTCVRCNAAGEGCEEPTPACAVGAGADGKGLCVGCLSNADCSDAAPLCDTVFRTCRVCLGDDTGCEDPTPACDTTANGGLGACMACVGNEDCPAEDPVCDPTAANGVGACVTCTATAGCAADQVCDLAVAGGACVTCTATAGCEAGEVCDLDVAGGACVTCRDSNDCPGTAPVCDLSVEGGACVVCTETAGCSNGQVCDTAVAGGACVECRTTADCDAGVCDPAAQECVTCLADGTGCTAPAAICDVAVDGGACKACLGDGTGCSSDTALCDVAAGNGVGACVACLANTDCTAGVCDTSAGACVECVATADCTAGVCNTTSQECVTCLADGTGCAAPAAMCDVTADACVECLAATDCVDAGDVCDAGACRLAVSVEIDAVRDAANGTVSLPVTGAFVTYVRPAVPTDPAGFFVQGEPTGPALFVAVDAATLNPSPIIGDKVSFTVTTKATSGSNHQATAITGWTVLSNGNPITGFVQNLTAATDVVTNLDDYASELVSLTATVAGSFGGAGGTHVSASIDTTGITGNSNYKFRMPAALRESLDLDVGCALTLVAGPMWRYNAQAQPSAYFASDLTGITCPAVSPVPQVAVATGSTTVEVTFDRPILPSSVLASGSQFTFTGGLTATAAAVDGKVVTITTSAQSGTASYTLTIANTVTGLYGAPVGTPTSPLTFDGFSAPVGGALVINEVDYDEPGTDVQEFVELFNGTSAAIDLSTYALVLVNGNGSVEYQRLLLTGSIPANGYYVVHMSGLLAPIPGGTATQVWGFGTGMQNGAPDGVALIETTGPTLVDALSYEGAITAASITGFTAPVSLVAGNAATVLDTGVAGSLCRTPNGMRVGNDAVDWTFCPTVSPGAANVYP